MDEEELLRIGQQAIADFNRSQGPVVRTGVRDTEPTRAFTPPTRADVRDSWRRGMDRLREPMGSAAPVRMAAQGATFGFADEIEAGVRAPFSPRSYGEIRDDVRDQNAAFREAEPARALALEVGGGMLSGNAAIRGLQALRGTSAPVSAIRSMAAGPVRQGILGGAVAGVGYDEDGVTFQDALQGAALGGGAVAGLNTILRAPGALSQWAASRSGAPERVEGLARDAVRRQVERAGGTDAVRELALEATGPSRIVDVLPEGARRTVRGARVRGGEQADQVSDALLSRRDAATERVASLARRGLGGEAADVEDVSRQIHQAAGELADQSYGEVFARGAEVRGEGLVRLLRNPTVRKAWERVATIDRNLRDAGQAGRYHLDLGDAPSGDMALARLDEFAQRGKMDLASADALKRGLDDVIRNGLDGQTIGGLKGETRASVIGLKSQLVRLADEADEAARGTGAGKSYREARREFETAMGWREALADGGKFVDMSPAQLRTMWGDLTPDEREVARLGFRSKVLDRLGKADAGRDRTRGLLGSPDFQEKVRVIFGQEGDEFLRGLRHERRIADTDRFVLGGSPTADKMVDAGSDLAFTPGDMAEAVFSATSPTAMASLALRKGVGVMDRLREGTVGRIGDAASKQYMRPVSEVDDFLTWLAQENKTSRRLADRVPWAGVGAVLGGRLENDR